MNSIAEQVSLINKASRVYSALRQSRPRTKQDLKNYVKVFLGIDVPGKSICSNHTAPMDYLAHSFFSDFTADLTRDTPIPVARPSLWHGHPGRVFHGLEARATNQAKIINMVDVGAIRPWSEYAVYCSSKAGLIGATKALAKELAPAICVNAVAPGTATWPIDFSQTGKDHQLSFIPAGRIAGTNEITPAIIFLLESDYITGQVLCVDGGRSI